MKKEEEERWGEKKAPSQVGVRKERTEGGSKGRPGQQTRPKDVTDFLFSPERRNFRDREEDSNGGGSQPDHILTTTFMRRSTGVLP